MAECEDEIIKSLTGEEEEVDCTSARESGGFVDCCGGSERPCVVGG